MKRLNHTAMKKLSSLPPEDVDGLKPVFLSAHAGGSVRVEEWESKTWFVAQTTAAVSKVLNGELLPAEELAIFAEAWNGRPVPVRHPQNDQGLFVSANSPEILSKYNVGYFFNARSEPHDLGVKLRGEMWLDVDLIEANGGAALEALEYLRDGGTVEVSTGYFCNVREGSGEFGGEQYNGVQYNIKPDHIALLPDQTGACSVEDGCGCGRTNEQEGQGEEEAGSVVSNVLEPGKSAMVAVVLSEASSAALALGVEGLDVTDPLHVTLAYLGEGSEVTIDRESLLQTVDWISNGYYVTSAKVGGSFRFYGEDEDAVGYLVDGEQMASMRRDLVMELSWFDQFVSRPKNWVPHVTIGYTSDPSVAVPAPALDLFAVRGLSVFYGEEVVYFPLRGELGAPYLPINRGDNQMSEENMNTNETGDTGEGAPVPAGIEVEGFAEVQDFMKEVKEAGGVSAIIEAIEALKANQAGERNGAIERIKAMTDQYTDADLEGMTTEQITKAADVLGAVKTQAGAPVNYAANVGGSQAGTVGAFAGNQSELVPYDPEA